GQTGARRPKWKYPNRALIQSVLSMGSRVRTASPGRHRVSALASVTHTASSKASSEAAMAKPAAQAALLSVSIPITHQTRMPRHWFQHQHLRPKLRFWALSSSRLTHVYARFAGYSWRLSSIRAKNRERSVSHMQQRKAGRPPANFTAP